MGQRQQSKAILVSMTTYPSVSLAAALAVALTAGALGKNTSVAVYGGAAWVFLLIIIVTMPILAPLVANRLSPPSEPAEGRRAFVSLGVLSSLTHRDGGET